MGHSLSLPIEVFLYLNLALRPKGLAMLGVQNPGLDGSIDWLIKKQLLCIIGWERRLFLSVKRLNLSEWCPSSVLLPRDTCLSSRRGLQNTKLASIIRPLNFSNVSSYSPPSKAWNCPWFQLNISSAIQHNLIQKTSVLPAEAVHPVDWGGCGMPNAQINQYSSHLCRLSPIVAWRFL